MFTGIVTAIGKILELKLVPNKALYLRVEVYFPVSPVAIGASVSHNGVCLTVVNKGENWLGYDISPETVACTTIAGWKVGDILNIEPALKMGDEFGGHLVLGHIDGVTSVQNIQPFEGSYQVSLALLTKWAAYIAPKGSIVLDGVSLTVNQVDDQAGTFTVMIVPHTWEHTIFKFYTPGHKVNLEIDVVARYIARYMAVSK
jgi:riboflavin synthase